MFVRISNTPRDYAWGTLGEISELLGVEPSGLREAELWLGAHPGSPARIVDPAQTHGAVTLADWIASDPALTLGPAAGGEPRLPFLLKVLSAGSPLSLQAHPTAEQAIAGFGRDHAAGIPIDAPNRNYRDAFPKPEMIYALSETFDALCGFRPADDLRRSIERLVELDTSADLAPSLAGWLDRVTGDDSLRDVFEWLISNDDSVKALGAGVAAIARANPGEFPTVALLAEAYPGDPGVLISLMLHAVRLARGEALFLPAGNIHAYLNGLGIELMTASDNVLRGGLTPKHVDVDELLNVLDFRPVAAPYIRPTVAADGALVFCPAAKDFLLVRFDADGALPLRGPAIALCTGGEFALSGMSSVTGISLGQSFYITPNERQVSISGSGELFVATTG